MTKTDSLIPIERIASQIYLVRSQKVMLDRDLAALYGVETRALNQAVTRNRSRFPEDFMFRLSWEEYRALRSQNVILESSGRGRHRKYTPRAFTQEGVAMLSGVLRSKRAVEVRCRGGARHFGRPGASRSGRGRRHARGSGATSRGASAAGLSFQVTLESQDHARANGIIEYGDKPGSREIGPGADTGMISFDQPWTFHT